MTFKSQYLLVKQHKLLRYLRLKSFLRRFNDRKIYYRHLARPFWILDPDWTVDSCHFSILPSKYVFRLFDMNYKIGESEVTREVIIPLLKSWIKSKEYSKYI